MLEGGFHHTDDLGNDSIVLAGGLQKFTAGRGIVHSELPGTKGLNRGLQLRVRLPANLATLNQIISKSSLIAYLSEKWMD
jgi:redox-sensitive bicupin YhaK (pirin superfamily)